LEDYSSNWHLPNQSATSPWVEAWVAAARTASAIQTKLTAIKVAKLTQPGRYGDGGGLYLQISKWKTKAWLFRFERLGRERQMGLGSVELIPLADARELAREARRAILGGSDPIELRAAERAADLIKAASGMTFAQCAEAYLAAHSASWRNEKHRAQWGSTLRRYAFPVLGKLPAAIVDTTLVVKVLEPIWAQKTETANRLRGRIEKILDWARVMEKRSGENPARWLGHLDHLLPRKSKIAPTQHHPALPYKEVPAFMAVLAKQSGMGARALEFTILTAARTGAVIGAKWDEIDLKAKLWTVPAQRAGTKIVGQDSSFRRVPLSAPALKILRAIPREQEGVFIFIGRRPGTSLSNMAMLELMRNLRPGFVPHGFRSSFKDWCSETTSYPNEVSEAALWHVVEDKVEAAYRRGDLMAKRRALMEDWACYCESTLKGSTNRRRRNGSRRPEK
jgi:integrase